MGNDEDHHGERQGRNTFKVFGDPADPGYILNTYSMERSIADGSSVPVHVETRLLNFHLDKSALDEAFGFGPATSVSVIGRSWSEEQSPLISLARWGPGAADGMSYIASPTAALTAGIWCGGPTVRKSLVIVASGRPGCSPQRIGGRGGGGSTQLLLRNGL